MHGLCAGYAEGLERPLSPLAPRAAPTLPFRPYETRSNGTAEVIAGRTWQARRLRREASRAAARGAVVTLILLSPTARFHRLRFHPDGYWEQRGGLFGRSDRSQPLFRFVGFRRRVAEESARVARQRGH